MDYFQLKTLHMTLAIVSVIAFIVRWFWMRSESALFEHKLTRSLPHIIDTLFLGSGIWLAFTIQQFPFAHHWLTAKLIGLIFYIILGSLALKRAKPGRARTLCFIAALIVFTWIISIARSKSVWGVLQI